MSEESKKPPPPGSAPIYRTHFEMWEAAAPAPTILKDAIDDADAPPLRNGRRVWTTPVLTTTPFASHSLPPVPIVLPQPWPPEQTTTAAAVVVGALLAILVTFTWRSLSSSTPAANVVAVTKPQSSPKAMPLVAKPDQKKAAPAPAMAAVASASKAATVPAKTVMAPLVKSAPIASVAAVSLPKPMASPAAPAKVAAIAAPKPAPFASAAQPAKVAVAEPIKPTAMPSAVAPLGKVVKIEPAQPGTKQPAVAAIKPVVAPQIAMPPKQPLAASSPSAPAKPETRVNVAAIPPVVKPPEKEAKEVKEVAKPAQAAPAIEPPPVQPTSGDDVEEEPDEPGDTASQLAQVRAELLEASIRSGLAQEGYSNLGVSVTTEGDVFLDGTFLNPADQDRVIAKLRARPHVRDIYFSGTVWHPEKASAPATNANVASVGPAKPGALTPPTTPASSAPAVDPKHSMVAHSEEFPVTAAEAPSAPSRYAAPLEAKPTVQPTLAPGQSIWPFRWMNSLR